MACAAGPEQPRPRLGKTSSVITRPNADPANAGSRPGDSRGVALRAESAPGLHHFGAGGAAYPARSRPARKPAVRSKRGRRKGGAEGPLRSWGIWLSVASISTSLCMRERCHAYRIGPVRFSRKKAAIFSRGFLFPTISEQYWRRVLPIAPGRTRPHPRIDGDRKPLRYRLGHGSRSARQYVERYRVYRDRSEKFGEDRAASSAAVAALLPH